MRVCMRGLREVCEVWVCGCGVCGLHAGSARYTGFGSVAAGSAGFVGFAGLLEEGEYRGLHNQTGVWRGDDGINMSRNPGPQLA